MRTETEEAVAQLIDRSLFAGGGVIDASWAVVPSEQLAIDMAGSAAWENFCIRAYTGIVTKSLQGKLVPAEGELTRFFEELRSRLIPISKQLQGSKWCSVTRFPFELLLSACFAELEFNRIVSPIFFAPRVLPVLLAGHYPCGWDGEQIPKDFRPSYPADFPDGKLCVYLCGSGP